MQQNFILFRKHLSVLFLLSFGVQSFAQDIRFQKRYYTQEVNVGQKNFHTNFYDIEALRDGGFLVQGFIQDTFNFQEGYIARYDCLGNQIWGKILGPSGSPTNTVFGAVETVDGDIVFSYNLGTGFFQGSILCGRIAQDGTTKWMKRFGNNTEFGRDIVQTQDGGFVIVGSTSFFGTDRRAADIYVLKINPNGGIEWSKTLGTPNTTYDEAYAVKTDSKNRLIITGRCIADTTFQAFLLKMDVLGNVLQFKTYGYHNQRTNSFDVLVDKEDNYIITGFTTLLEVDHASSEADPFLIKTDSLLQLIFANVYEVNVGRDFSTLGESLALLDDGGYAIGVSSLSFSLHNDASGPNSPGKNALYIVNKDGSLRKAFIYNMKGSQYTRVRKSYSGGLILSGFTTAFTGNVGFQGLIIKVNNQFQSGCGDIDVTRELSVFKPSWTVADYVPEIKSGKIEVDYFNFSDSLIKKATICEEFPTLTPDFISPDSACPGEILFEEASSGPFDTKVWIIGKDTFPNTGTLKYSFTKSGTYDVTLFMQFSCIQKSITKSIKILDGVNVLLEKTICAGETFSFRGKHYNTSSLDTLRFSGTGSCDSLFYINVTVIQPNKMTTELEYCELPVTYKRKIFSTGGKYILEEKDSNGCISLVEEINLVQKYKIGNVSIVHDTFCFQYRLDSILYKESFVYDQPVSTNDPCVVDTVRTIFSKQSIEFPNVFLPGNIVEKRNHIFRPIVLCKSDFLYYRMKIYNRYGQMVFESNKVIDAWDGTSRGSIAPAETYLVHVEFRLDDDPDFIHAVKTAVTLLR